MEMTIIRIIQSDTIAERLLIFDRFSRIKNEKLNLMKHLLTAREKIL